MPALSAAEVIRLLDLKPHPEGGHFRETFRDELTVHGTRAASTAIYFLLARGDHSRWHRIDAVEIWHYHAGARAGARPQAIVPAHAWQSARSLGEWTLVSCTVAPGFDFGGFEAAPAGWTPG